MQLLTPIRQLYFIVFFLASFGASAQTAIESILEQPVSDLPAFDTTHCKNCIFLEIPYGTSDFRNLDVLKRFEGNDIMQVDMVFSSFARTEGFDQLKLNRQRLANFQIVAPELFENDEIAWTMLRQTACKSLEESEKLFHGFVVHIIPGKSKVDNSGKLTPVDIGMVNPPGTRPPESRTHIETRDTTIKKMSVSMREVAKKDCKETGRYIPNKKKKARKGIRYKTEGNGRKPEKKCKTISYGYVYDTTYYDRKYKVNVATGKLIDPTAGMNRANDTIVLDVMGRNWDKWKSEKVIVVQDVTGSMGSYLIQILKWHELSAAKGVDQYLFFNDGDDKPDSKKVIGKTGGIYHVNSNRLLDIQNMAQKAGDKGSGGDIPENNIEAAIAAQSKCPGCTAIIMIADNYAPVKDLALLKKVKKPVHVVVCGGNGEQVHSDYLTIAAVTGGSVHTSKLDMTLAGKAVEGYQLSVGERKYEFRGGRFYLSKN